MKRLILKLAPLILVAVSVAERISINCICRFFWHQPEIPEELK